MTSNEVTSIVRLKKMWYRVCSKPLVAVFLSSLSMASVVVSSPSWLYKLLVAFHTCFCSGVVLGAYSRLFSFFTYVVSNEFARCLAKSDETLYRIDFMFFSYSERLLVLRMF